MSFNSAVIQMLDDKTIRNKARDAYCELVKQTPGETPWSNDVIEVIFDAIRENLP